MKDYFEFSIEDPYSKLVTSHLVRNRRIVLRGIGAFVQVESGKPMIGYSYPCLGPLLSLVKRQEHVNDFSFNAKTRKWQVTKALKIRCLPIPKELQ